MESILRQINKSNYRERDGNVYISKLLFVFVTDMRDTSAYRSRNIDGVEFIEIASIPSYIRSEYGFFRITAARKPKDDDKEEIPEFRKHATDNKVFNMERDVLKAVKDSWKLKHEFIDYFTDSEMIKEKAVTLSLLNLLRFNGKLLDEMKLIHQAILKLDIKCELRISEWEDFYKHYQWFCRTTFIRGLIRPLNKPSY